MTTDRHRLDPQLAIDTIEALPCAVVVLDRSGRIDYVNPCFEELSGYTLNDLRGAEWATTFGREHDHDRYRRFFTNESEQDETRGLVIPISTRDGDELRVSWRRVVHPSPRGLTGTVWMGKEIRAEDSVGGVHAHTDGRLRQILDGMFAFVGLYDLDGNVIEANRPPLEQAGLSRGDVIGRPFWETPWWNHSAATQEAVRSALQRAARGETVRADYSVRLAEDRMITLDTMFGPLRGEDGAVYGVVGSGVDVTERRQAENELRTHSQVLLSLQEGVQFVDPNGVIVFANPALERMFGYPAGELIGKHVSVLNDLSDEENRRLATEITSTVETRGSWEGEFRNRHADGSLFFTRARITALEVPQTAMWVAIQEDITERKKADEALRASLRETETLLREVHHRVKNNLQIISSLLYFQAQRVHDSRDLAAFEDGRKRLTSMILVHEKLYQAGELSRVEIGDYLRSLVSTLWSSFEDTQIALNLDTATVRLPIEFALPLGMIVCELVTNAFKYAFIDQARGSVRISVRRDGDSMALDVADDGVGFPPEFDVAGPRSFGWQLVRALVEQIDGTLETTNVGGARVVVTFRLPTDAGSE